MLSAVWLGLLAEAYGKRRQQEEGLTVLIEALRAVGETGEHFYEAELQRLKGVLLLQQNSNNQAEAEACFQQAIAIAQNQSAKSWELRAATSFARLWQQQGKRQEAHDLLAPVYGWFTEGFDTADLQDAKALLDELV
jgi:predicted ATPase